MTAQHLKVTYLCRTRIRFVPAMIRAVCKMRMRVLFRHSLLSMLFAFDRLARFVRFVALHANARSLFNNEETRPMRVLLSTMQLGASRFVDEYGVTIRVVIALVHSSTLETRPRRRKLSQQETLSTSQRLKWRTQCK